MTKILFFLHLYVSGFDVCGSRDRFADQWKWCVVIGRRRRRSILDHNQREKRNNNWRCRLMAKCFVPPYFRHSGVSLERDSTSFWFLRFNQWMRTPEIITLILLKPALETQLVSAGIVFLPLVLITQVDSVDSIHSANLHSLCTEINQLNVTPLLYIWDSDSLINCLLPPGDPEQSRCARSLRVLNVQCKQWFLSPTAEVPCAVASCRRKRKVETKGLRGEGKGAALILSLLPSCLP